MRILHLIQQLDVGGAERVVVSLVSGAAKAGHDVAVVAAPGTLATDLPCRRFDIPVLERRPSRIPAAALGLRRAITEWRPTLLHCHNPGMGFVGGVVTLRGRWTASFVSVHGVAEEDYRQAARVLRWSGLPVVPCGPGVAAALSRRGVRPLETIVNGISPPPRAANRDELLRRWGLRKTHVLLVSVGRLVPQKDHAVAIAAMRALPQASLVIYGEGQLRQELAEAAERTGVGDRVVLAGRQPDVRAAMGAADAVVITSRWEGLPLVALEALASGTPLVATDVRGLRELLHDGVDCLMVPPGDPERIADAIRRVLDPAVRSRLVSGGKAVAARHTEAEMVGRYLALYERLAARPARVALMPHW